ncbi:AAA family ATPase [Pelosinus sp. sgz500959]|uniref:AAA family ATPase n=1 Tax=Pelosinus sp. sgz500959 TaxID=3242472 RepID=UPI0036700F63
MQVLYLWIKDHRDFICKQNVNFGSKFIFSYNEELKQLNVEENPSYIKFFFSITNSDDKSVITNISAIIGENGSGKTTILNFIKRNLVYGMGGIREEAIIVVEDGSNKYIYHHNSIKITSGNFDTYNFTLKEYEYRDEKGGLIDYYIDSSGNTSVIYFSNIFDNTIFDKDYGNLIDISTNSLVKSDRIRMVENHRISGNASEIEIHRIQEINRQIRFLGSSPKNKDTLPFQLPKKIIIKPFVRNPLETRKNDYYELIMRVKEAFSSHQSDLKSGADSIKSKLIEAVIYNFFSELTSHKTLFEIPVDILINLEKADSINERVRVFFEELLSADCVKEIRNVPEWIKGINDFIKLINSNEFEYVLPFGQGLVLPVDKENSLLAKLLECYQQSFLMHPYLEFQWIGLSSGEMAIFNLFSRFYSIIDPKEHTDLLKDNVIVLIDEGELYFHPQWQKELIYNLISFYNDIFRGRHVQLIITSNSPFIASDLPNHKIIFLNKIDGKSIVVDGLEDKKQTFAANIHTLYTDSFFVRDGLIGKFAKHKIQNLINLLMNGKIDEIKRNKKMIERTIRLIGEPIIRAKLLRMFEEALTLNLMDIDDKIINLQEQINKLTAEKLR